MTTEPNPNERQPVRLAPPPAALIKALNPIVRAITGTPMSRVLPKWMAVVEVTGWKSGAQQRIPCGVHDVNAIPTIFTDRPWRLNFRGGVPVTVVQRGTRR